MSIGIYSKAELKGCMNIPESGGVECVKCNCCGQFDKSTQKQCGLDLYNRLLEEEYQFDGWIEGAEELQQENIQINIEAYKEMIAKFEQM